MFSGPAKAGKSTAVGNIVRALVDGTPIFADHREEGGFAVAPLLPGESVFLADFEMPRKMLRRWMDE